MVTVDQVFQPFFIVLQCFGIHLSPMKTTIKWALMVLSIVRYIYEQLEDVSILMLTFNTGLWQFCWDYDKGYEFHLGFGLSVTKLINFSAIIIWKESLIVYGNNNLYSAMKQQNVDNTILRKISCNVNTTIFCWLFCVIVTFCLMIYNMQATDYSSIIPFAVFEIYCNFSLFVVPFIASLLLILCGCFLVELCNYILLELEIVEKEIKMVKSPYRLNRIFLQSLKKFEKLENLIKAVSSLFVVVYSVAFFGNILPVAMLVHYFILFFCYDVELNEYDAIPCITSFFILICGLKMTWFTTQLNSKKRVLIKVIQSQLSSEQHFPLQFIPARFNQLNLIVNGLIMDDEWFLLLNFISIDEELILAIFQTWLGFCQSVTLYADKNRFIEASD
ncbi:hypothetical protein CHUAL_011371 [Chamberlinius hualienensis]